MFAVTRFVESNFSQRGARCAEPNIVLVHHGFSSSLDGMVKLWDLRGTSAAIKTWDLQPNGLSAFDVHGQASVFAA
jgi:hypothetical protein